MRRSILCAIFLAFILPLAAQEEVSFKVREIWGQDTYNAFTSLVKFKGKYYCAFREGEGHVFDSDGKAAGKVRIISSPNGRRWKSVHLFGMEGKDCRDPKLSITPDGRLCVSFGASVYVDRKLVDRGPYVCFSQDGAVYSDPVPCVLEGSSDHTGDWIWRTTWKDDTGYSVNYYSDSEDRVSIELMKTSDGVVYSRVCGLDVPDFPNEATIRFLSDGRMAMMVRRDSGDGLGYWGISKYPYTEWEWKKMPMKLGGPDFLMVDDSKVIAASRCHYIQDSPSTSVFTGDASTGHFLQRIVLPSGGDTSYCGLLIEGDELWVSYYSAHISPRPRIYLARIPLKCLE